MKRIAISAGPLLAEIVPGLGGSLARLALRRNDGSAVELMRPLSAEAEATGDVLGTAMFPMLPYANLIENNTFTFGGRRYTFMPNFPPMRDATHGSGWISRWTPLSATASRLQIELRDDAVGAPYQFLARQAFVVTPQGLAVTMTIANIGPQAMPFGFGLHPWFIRTAGTTLRFAARSVWLEGYDGVPTEAIAVPPELAFTQPTRLPAARRNLCYAGWDGRAEIVWPEWRQGLAIEAEPALGHLMFYTPKGAPHFCVEPQSNAAGAFNRLEQEDPAALGVIVLKPGEKSSATVRFFPFAA